MRPGEQYLKAVVSKHKAQARIDDPRPYDEDWGWWVEARLQKLETGQLWLIRIAGGALAAQIIRIICETTGLV